MQHEISLIAWLFFSSVPLFFYRNASFCRILSTFAGGAPLPKPQIGPEEQPPLHPGPVARYIPAPAHGFVTLRGQNGNPGGKWVFSSLHGELDQEDQANQQFVQGGQGAHVWGELATQVRVCCQVPSISDFSESEVWSLYGTTFGTNNCNEAGTQRGSDL